MVHIAPFILGQLEMEVFNELGRRTGYIRHFHENGQLKSQGNYVNGQLSGDLTVFFADGSIQAEYHYANGLKTGKNLEYFENGDLKIESDHSRNGSQVTVKEFWGNGEVKSLTYLVNGNPDGEWTYFDDRGRELLTENYLDGVLHGARMIYERGVLTRSENYLFGKKNGEFIEYYSRRKVKLRATYKLDFLTGPYIKFHDNGEPEYTGQYVRNERHGPWTFFDRRGNVLRSVTYELGTQIESSDQ